MDYLQYKTIMYFIILHISVLNLIINGLPSIPRYLCFALFPILVLNLIINGLPSIRMF